MKSISWILLAWLLAIAVQAQEEKVTLEDVLEAGKQWLQENVDDNVLQQLEEIDRNKVEQFLRDLQQSLQGDNVLDLAKLKPAALTILPLLEQYEETLPYAAWLKARLDYLEASERMSAPPLQSPEKGGLVKPVSLKTGQDAENKAWQSQIEKRPAPKEAESLVARIKPIFAAQKVPPQLVWMAEVESSFDPGARSPAGAAGLFQLMPATAQNLGLNLRPQDERLSPEKNAQAASEYLETLYRKFGNWPLAIAAYNAGESRVQSLLEKHKAKTFAEIADCLPAETQMYVPRVDATLQLREGIKLAKLEPVKGSPAKANK